MVTMPLIEYCVSRLLTGKTPVQRERHAPLAVLASEAAGGGG